MNFLTMKMKIIPQSDVVHSDDDVLKERRGEKAKVVLTVKACEGFQKIASNKIGRCIFTITITIAITIFPIIVIIVKIIIIIVIYSNKMKVLKRCSFSFDELGRVG